MGVRMALQKSGQKSGQVETDFFIEVSRHRLEWKIGGRRQAGPQKTHPETLLPEGYTHRAPGEIGPLYNSINYGTDRK